MFLDLAQFLQVTNIIFLSHIDDSAVLKTAAMFYTSDFTFQLVSSVGNVTCRKEFENSLLVDASGYHRKVEDQELCFKRRFHWLLAHDALSRPPLALRLDSTFITVRQDGNEVLLTEHYRIKHKLFEKKFGSWNVTEGLDIPISDIWERRRNLDGITLTLATLPFPGVIHPTADGFEGLGASYITTLSALSNFTLEWTMPDDQSWGIPLGNGSWNGIVGMVQKKEVDIGVAPLAVTLERSEVIDFLPDLFFKTRVALHIVNPAYVDASFDSVNFLAYVRVFAPGAWLLLLAIFVLICVGHYAAMKRNPFPHQHISLSGAASSSLEFAYKNALQLDIAFTVKGFSSKVFLLTTSAFSIVIMAHYEAMITSFMTQKTQLPEIDSFADTIDLGYQVVVEKGTYHLTRFQTAPVGSGMQRVYEEMIKDNPDAIYPSVGDAVKTAMLKNPRLALASAEYRFPGDQRFLALTHLSDAFEDFVSFAYQACSFVGS